jgi:hypothetical protein
MDLLSVRLKQPSVTSISSSASESDNTQVQCKCNNIWYWHEVAARGKACTTSGSDKTRVTLRAPRFCVNRGCTQGWRRMFMYKYTEYIFVHHLIKPYFI